MLKPFPKSLLPQLIIKYCRYFKGFAFFVNDFSVKGFVNFILSYSRREIDIEALHEESYMIRRYNDPVHTRTTRILCVQQRDY